MAYAEGTKVSVEKSILEIMAMSKKAGATRIAQAELEDGLAIQFEMNERKLRFKVTVPPPPDRRGARPASASEMTSMAEARYRQRARALLLVIKAKLESVESGVETFEDAFLANIVTPSGKTVGEEVRPAIAQAYASGAVQPLLPGW